ncbi:hypothetical protein [Streptomyces altiplanensis]
MPVAPAGRGAGDAALRGEPVAGQPVHRLRVRAVGVGGENRARSRTPGDRGAAAPPAPALRCAVGTQRDQGAPDGDLGRAGGGGDVRGAGRALVRHQQARVHGQGYPGAYRVEADSRQTPFSSGAVRPVAPAPPVGLARFPQTRTAVFPELHLCGSSPGSPGIWTPGCHRARCTSEGPRGSCSAPP